MKLNSITRKELAFLLNISYRTVLRQIKELDKKYPQHKLMYNRKIPIQIIEVEFGLRLADIMEEFKFQLLGQNGMEKISKCPQCFKKLRPCLKHRFLYAVLDGNEVNVVRDSWVKHRMAQHSRIRKGS